jgi:predicted ribosome-associated RNA-binding protein Tma20
VIAVGAMASDYMENNAEGVAVYLLHHFNDKLYEISPQTFTKKII